MKNNSFIKSLVFYLHVFYFHYILEAIILFLLVSNVSAQSEVTLSVRAGGSGLIGVGIEGFEPLGESKLVLSVKNTLAEDLSICGLFKVRELPDSLHNSSESLFSQWLTAGATCFIYGEETRGGKAVGIKVIDLKTAVTMMDEEYLIREEQFRYTAHIIADDVIEIFNGIRGSMASQIAYIQVVGENKELFLMDPDGKRSRQMTYSRTLNLSPNWSSDGNSIAFSSLGGENWIIVMINVNTGQTLDVTQWPGMNTTPSWSPVMSDIMAFSSTRDGNLEIYTCRKNGKELRRLTNHYSIDSSPTWSPDGSQIAFTSDRAGLPKIYVMNSDGTKIHRLTSNIDTYEDSPRWSPRGDRIAFVIMSDYGFDIATMSSTGEDMVMLTFGSGSNENPQWSPDGLRILFTSNRLGGKNLFVMNWDGSNVRSLTRNGKSLSPSWAPTASGDDIRISSQR